MNRAGGIRGGFATQFDLVTKAIVPDIRRRLEVARKRAADMQARVRVLVAQIVKTRHDSAKVAKQEDREVVAFNRKKKPSREERAQRASKRAAHVQQREQLGLQVKADQAELGTLTGNKEFAAADLAGMGSLSEDAGTLGKTLAERDRYQTSLDSDPGWIDKARPSQLPSSIRDWDYTIAELIKNGATKPDNTQADQVASERADLYKTLYRQANLKALISERAFGTIADFDREYPGMYRPLPPAGGVFHTGGIVPGVTGQERTIVAKAREGVFTEEQMAKLAPAGGDGASIGNVQVLVHGDIVSDRRDPVEVLINDQRFPAAVRRANRGDLRGYGRTPGVRGA